MTIQSFGDKTTEAFFYEGTLPKKRCGWTSKSKGAARNLDILNAVAEPKDLRVLPNHNFEKLRGDLKGFFSIRIDDSWRVVFRWGEQGPEDVEIMDDH